MARRAARIAAAAALAIGSFATLGHAREAPRSDGHEPERAERDPPLPPGDEPRPAPEYAEPAPTSAGDVVLWVPRVLLFPLYLATEYGIRRPVGALYIWAERHEVRQRYHEFFTFDEEQKVGLFPTVSIDLGLRPTFGGYFSWLDAVGESDIKLRVTTGGLDLWTVNSLLHAPVDARSYLRFQADYARRPDSTFHGLGRRVQDEGAHYLAERYWGRVSFTRQHRQLTFTADSGVVAARFDPGPDGVAHQALADAIATGRFEAPPALHDGVLALFTGVGARFDTRPPRRPPIRTLRDLDPPGGTGFTVALHAAQFSGLQSTRASAAEPASTPHWLRYGGALGYSLDLTGTHRTLQLETACAAVEPLPTKNPVPFTEQISLGGSYPLRAFTGGRLIDESAVVATLSYNWPLLPNLDGALHYSVGNVFARHLRDFELARLRSSFGIGMETVGSQDQPFEILFALGTKPFEEGGGIDAMRFVFGTPARF